MRRQIGHHTIHHPLVDEDLTYLSMDKVQRELNEKLNMELSSQQFNIKIFNEL
jgi:hypothetical protein